MMPTAEELQARLDKLRAQRADGVRSVQSGDERVEYRTDAEIAAAIADLEGQLSRAAGRTLPRLVNIRSTKGW